MAQSGSGFLRRHRRLLVVLIAVVVVYTLMGFLLVPWIAKRQIVSILDEKLGLESRIEQLRANPYSLTATVRGFSANRPGESEILGFDGLFLNVQLSSLFRWAWTFKEIRLTGSRIDVILQEDGTLNLAALIPKEDPAEGSTEPDAPPRVIIHTFVLESGRGVFEDRALETPFQTALGPLSLTLTEFSTLPDDDGDMAFETTGESGARLTWRGVVSANPIRSEGQITLEDGPVPAVWRYIQDLVDFRITEGEFDSTVHYAADYSDGEFGFAMRDVSVVVENLAVTSEDDAEVLGLSELRLDGATLEWPARRIGAEDLRLAGLHLELWRDPEGTINALELLGAGSTTEVDEGMDEPTTPAVESEAETEWTLTLDRLVVEEMSAGFADRATDPPLETGIESLRLEVRDLNNLGGETFDFELALDVTTGGSATAEGRLGVLPPVLDATTQLEGLSLVPLQTYLTPFVKIRLDSAAVSADGTLTSDEEERLRYRGRVEVAGASVSDTRDGKRLLAIESLTLGDTLYELDGARVRVASADLSGPYAKLTIHRDGTTNIGEALGADPAGETGGPSDGGDELPIVIELGEVIVREGAADFADLTLPLPFAARVHALEGKISEIATGRSSARVEADGTVDEHGLVRVEGSLDFFAPDRSSDVEVSFRNVEMSSLSPYTTKFAGYAIEEGRLSVDLHYRIENRQLDSENKILIDELTLGEKIESPDAPKLPVRMAVALLKDKNGRIDLDLPVQGSLDNPEFSYGKLVMKAMGNVVTKIATAPFRALARLVGGGDKDLEHVEFTPASSELTPPAREKLTKLSEALGERPELVLEVRGVFDGEVDGTELREQKLEKLVAERIESAPELSGDEPVLASDRERAALEGLFLESFGREELDAVVAAHTVPGESSGEEGGAPPEPRVDLSALVAAIRQRLESAQTVSDDELFALADARAGSITGYIRETGGVPADRMRVVESELIKKGDESFVAVRLVLDAG